MTDGEDTEMIDANFYDELKDDTKASQNVSQMQIVSFVLCCIYFFFKQYLNLAKHWT